MCREEFRGGKYGVCTRPGECYREYKRRKRAADSPVSPARKPCELCGEPTASEHGVCRRKANPECVREYQRRKARQRYAANGEEIKRRNRIRSTSLHGKAMELRNNAHQRARDRGLPFDLTLDWVEAELAYVLEHGCPYLDIPVTLDRAGQRHCPNSPSIDQIDPGAGYTQENCVIVSWQANRLKSDMSLETLQLLARNVARVSRAARVKAA